MLANGVTRPHNELIHEYGHVFLVNRNHTYFTHDDGMTGMRFWLTGFCSWESTGHQLIYTIPADALAPNVTSSKLLQWHRLWVLPEMDSSLPKGSDRWVVSHLLWVFLRMITGISKNHWKRRVPIMLTVLSLVASEIVFMTTVGAASDYNWYYDNSWFFGDHIVNGLVQERRNSIANALELRLSCTNPSMYTESLWMCHGWIPRYFNRGFN